MPSSSSTTTSGPRGVGLAEAQRGDIEGFLASLLARWKPATAANRYGGLAHAGVGGAGPCSYLSQIVAARDHRHRRDPIAVRVVEYTLGQGPWPTGQAGPLPAADHDPGSRAGARG